MSNSRRLTFFTGENYEVPLDTGCTGCFIHQNINNLPAIFRPVFDRNGIRILQDNEVAVPGLYIISPIEHYDSINNFPIELYNTFSHARFHLMKVMKQFLGDDLLMVQTHSEGRLSGNAHYHEWFIPYWKSIADKYKIVPKIYLPKGRPGFDNYIADIYGYMQLFKYNKKTKQRIQKYNQLLTKYFNEI
jgi:hypothetical protein